MFDQQPQPTPEEIAQRLRLMDARLEQQYPGYLRELERLRQPCESPQDGQWNRVMQVRHVYMKGWFS